MLEHIQNLLQPAPTQARMLVLGWPHGLSAAELLAASQALNVKTFVVSPSEEHVQAFERAGGLAFCGDLRRDLEGSHSQFSALLLDAATLHAPGQGGPDLTWKTYLHAMSYLQAGGALLLRLPRNELAGDQRRLARLLGAFRELSLQADGPGQVLVTGQRRGTRGPVDAAQLAALWAALRADRLPGLDRHRRIALKDTPAGRRPWFRSRLFDPAQMERFAQQLPWPQSELSASLFGHQPPLIEPVLPLRATHLAAVVAAGAMGTLALTSKSSGRRVVLRGRTLRRERTVEASPDVEEESGYAHAASAREQIVADFVTQIAILDMDSAELELVDPSEGEAMQAFLEEWGDALAAAAAVSYPASYDPQQVPYWELLREELVALIDRPLQVSGAAVLDLSGTGEPALTIAQRHLLAGLFLKMLGRGALLPERRAAAREVRQQKRFLLSGEPAVGKTMIALRLLAGLALHDARLQGRRIGARGWPLQLFVTTLANVDHIVREARKAAPLFIPRVVETMDDLQQVLGEARSSAAPILMIISRTRLRAADQIEAAFLPPRAMAQHGEREDRAVGVHCARCGEAYLAPKELARRWQPRFLTGGAVKGRGRKCPACDSPLYQQVHGTRSLAAALCRALDRSSLRLLAACFDEVHEDKGDSNQGQSMAWLADQAEYALGMSGTVYGGVPSDVFKLLFRLMPGFRKSWGWREAGAFVRRYGNWRQVLGDSGRWGRRQELPGLSPELTAGVFLSYAAFFTVEDAGLPMPPRDEIPIEVEPTADERAAQTALIETVRAELEASADAQEKRLTARSRHAQWLRLAPVGWHRPELAAHSPAWRCPRCGRSRVSDPPCDHIWALPGQPSTVADMDPGRVVTPALDPAWRASQELALARLLTQERREGRAALIFPYHTGRYAIHERLTHVLGDAGFRVLDAAPIPSRQLETRINQAPLEGYDAIVCNPQRVSTGPNLDKIPTLIWYQPLWSAQRMLQGSRRIDRATQRHAVRIFHVVGVGSAEMVILSRTVEKMIAVHHLAGTDYEGMAAVLDVVGHTQSFHEAMIAFVAARVETNLAALFQSLGEIEGKQRAAVPASSALPRPERRRAAIPPAGGKQLSLFPPAGP